MVVWMRRVDKVEEQTTYIRKGKRNILNEAHEAQTNEK